MTKLYAQEKQVFDINKVTVAGTPTITSDGMASGFSNSNYILIKQPTIDTTKPWEIKISFCTPTNQQEYVKGIFQLMGGDVSWNYLDFTTSSKLSFGGKDINGNTFFLTTSNTLEFNTIYDCVVGWDGAKYYIKYKKTTDDIYIESFANKSVPLETSTSTKWIKVGLIFSFGDARYAWVGSINLTKFSITVDGELVYSPTKPVYSLERRRPMVWDKEQFTVVGSPSISDSGVASGFSGSDYLKTGVTIGQNPFKIICKCDTPNSGSGVLVDNISGNGWYPLLLQSNNTIVVYAKDVNGNSVYTGGSIAIPYNQQFLVSFEFTGNKYILGLSIDDGITWTYKESENANYIANIDKELIIGRYGSFAQNGWLGSIDLTQFSITVDGKEVFTGAKEKFYAMRGGM